MPGIQPFDRYAIGEDYFMPSAVYNRKLPAQEQNHADYRNPATLSKNVPAQIFEQEIGSQGVTSENVQRLIENIQYTEPTPTLIASPNINSESLLQQPENSQELIYLSALGVTNIESGTITPPSIEHQYTTLQEIHPLPQITVRKTTRRRNPIKSEILTSTPIK